VSAPKFVPENTAPNPRSYVSPPSRRASWQADRPGEIIGNQPKGNKLGASGPDQGYAYKLVSLFEDRLITGKVDQEDAIAGCLALAMKRSALFGRAPVVHDLTAAFTIYGFINSDANPDLVNKREKLFPQVRSHHHYSERRHLVDIVDEAFLKKSHDEIKQRCTQDWSSPFG